METCTADVRKRVAEKQKGKTHYGKNALWRRARLMCATFCSMYVTYILLSYYFFLMYVHIDIHQNAISLKTKSRGIY